MMTDKPGTGTYKIISLLTEAPSGVIDENAKRVQSVCLNSHIQTWKLIGSEIFHFRIGGHRYTGVVDDTVATILYASKNMDWHVTYREVEEAYTIEPVNDPSLGWTVVNPDMKMSKIGIRPIKTKCDKPPQFFLDQLFRFVKVAEDE